ncbi:hypothetical protein N8456_02075 [Porticoccaceae bacterium]|nr:hypothetical protein [Porticoccaceae bacterium]
MPRYDTVSLSAWAIEPIDEPETQHKPEVVIEWYVAIRISIRH